MNLDSFKNIPERMYWRLAALEQIESFKSFAEKMGVPLSIPGKHRSKSIDLPVIHLQDAIVSVARDIDAHIYDDGRPTTEVDSDIVQGWAETLRAALAEVPRG